MTVPRRVAVAVAVALACIAILGHAAEPGSDDRPKAGSDVRLGVADRLAALLRERDVLVASATETMSALAATRASLSDAVARAERAERLLAATKTELQTAIVERDRRTADLEAAMIVIGAQRGTVDRLMGIVHEAGIPAPRR